MSGRHWLGLRPLPGSKKLAYAWTGGIASLNHRLMAVIPPGCLPELTLEGSEPLVTVLEIKR